MADVRAALYAAKVMSYTQGLNLIRAKSDEQGWGLSLGEMARIWKGGCIIRAGFLDRIKQAYDRDADLDALKAKYASFTTSYAPAIRVNFSAAFGSSLFLSGWYLRLTSR